VELLGVTSPKDKGKPKESSGSKEEKSPDKED
jgi:hypothetical protein